MFQQLSDLQAFYLIVAMAVLTIAFVYWADAIRERKEKTNKK